MKKAIITTLTIICILMISQTSAFAHEDERLIEKKKTIIDVSVDN